MKPNSPTRAQLENATQLHRAGARDEAVTIYRDILAREPRNADALFFLGIAHVETGAFEDALGVLKKAVRIAPGHAPALNLYGIALQETGQPDEALKSFHRAFTAQPDFLDAYRNRAKLLAKLGRNDDAQQTLDRAVAATGNAPEALNERGLWRAQAGRHADAIDDFDRALAVVSTVPALHANRGISLASLEQYEGAIESFERALAIDPQFAECHLNCGNVLRKLSRFDEAIARFDTAAAIRPDMREAHLSKGLAYLDLGRYADAIASLNAALSGPAPDADPRFQANVLSYRAWAHVGAGERSKALNDVATSRALAGDDPHLDLRLGYVQLILGDWAGGLPRYEQRLKLSERLPADIEALPLPRWDGQVDAGAKLVIVTEQGLGDAINFCGFIPALARNGMEVSLLTRATLAPLLSTVPGVGRVYLSAQEVPVGPSMSILPIMSLARALELTPQSIANDVPYLTPDPARVAAWTERLGAGFKVGIAWQGNPKQGNDPGRSMPLEHFAPLAALPEIRLISLQKAPGCEQIDVVPFRDRIERPLGESDTGGEALLETAALIAALDLVVVSDSMLAHLAGALGKPAFVALRHLPDWRWLLDRRDTPFYPTLRLFRQAIPGEWRPVFEEIAAAVKVAVNVSHG